MPAAPAHPRPPPPPLPPPRRSHLHVRSHLRDLSDLGGAADPATTTTSAGAYRAADVCTYLTGQLPTLKAIGAPAGVQANLAGNLFGFFQSHGVPADGAHLDDATKAQCPDVRSQILVLSGLTSFTQL